MTTPFDLILLPLVRHGGQDLPECQGLFAAAAPRRAARGRAPDRLILHLCLVGTAPLSPKGYTKLREHLVDLYFKTIGSSTAAMRAVAEWLNEYLLQRNRRGASRSMQATGILTLAVVRGNRLYLAQSGPAHAFLTTTRGVQHFHDPQLAGSGLGLGRATAIRYNQADVSANDVLVISPAPPAVWNTETLNGLRGLSFENLHRQLIQGVGGELEAAMLHFQRGRGNIKILRPEIAEEDAPEIQHVESSHQIPAVRQKTPPPQREADSVSRSEAPKDETSPPKVESRPLPLPVEKSVTPAVSTAPLKTEEKTPEPKPPRERVVGPALLKIGSAVGDTVRQSSQSIGTLFKSMLPDESLFSIPTPWMAFIAIAVPILVVVVAASIYFERGQTQLFEEKFLQAEYEFDQALKLQDPNDLRAGWNSVINYLDDAESYQQTDESQAMRAHAMSVLDSLDRVTRLTYQPAIIGGLPGSVQIRRIVVADDDKELYLLSNDGRVLRATLTDQGYVLANNFLCEPVHQPDSLIVESLVDITALPPGEPNNATVMGMDANGTLLFCIPNGQASLALQLPPPDMNWGKPSALSMDSSDLYVLDPVTNAVWIFWGADGLDEQPQLFFDAEIPLMGDVMDLTVHNDELFLLHDDGQLTTCTYGFPTRCTDQAIIKDINTGEEISHLTADAKFSELQFVTSPALSLYLLEPEMKAIFHLSKRLGYYEQYRPQNQLPNNPITAFAISVRNQAFLAIGNQIYFAQIP